jgi:ribonuclease HI
MPIVAICKDQKRSFVLLILSIAMTVALRYGRAAAACAGSVRREQLPMESLPSAFGYLLFRQRPHRRDRPWSSLVQSIALSTPVKAFVEGSSMPAGPRKLTRTTVRRMRVDDLRGELSQRELETTGRRSVLESRLIEALEQEGLLSAQMTRTNNSRPTRPSCKQEFPLAEGKQIEPTRTYRLRVIAKVATFSIVESGAGMLLFDSQNSEEVWAARQYFGTKRSSFEATYCALVMALRHCRDQGVRKIVLELSNDIMVDQLTGKMVVTKAPMKKLYWMTMDVLMSFEQFDVKFVPKEQNFSKAENLAEKAVATKKSIGIGTDIVDPLLPVPVDDATKTTKQSTPSDSNTLVKHGSDIDPSKQYLLRVDGGSRNNPGNFS